MHDDMLMVALGYAARGFSVFPTRGKVPLTRHGHLDATTKPEDVRAWFTRTDADIAIATGTPSGLVVLDCDPRHGGDDTLADFERTHGALPDTPRVLTGGGGEHVYFAHPGGTVPCSAGLLGPGLDIRADGGYVVAPPSRHASGRRYVWEVGADVGDVALAPVPPWLLEQLATIARRRLQRDGVPLIVTAGARNDMLMRLGCALRRYGIAEEAIREALEAVNRAHVMPPLDRAEIATIARSAARYKPGAHGTRPFLRVPKP